MSTQKQGTEPALPKTPKEFVNANYAVTVTYKNQFNDCEFSWDMVFTLMNDFADQETSQLKKEIDRLRSVLNRAMVLLQSVKGLVGNPGTNISGSTDIACDSWLLSYYHFMNDESIVNQKPE